MCYEKRDTEQARACFERDQRGEKMAEYIEREAAYEKCGWYNTVNGKSVCAVRKDELAAIPAADVVPVVHGWWIHDINNLYGCSECLGRETMSPKKLKPYCPNCGARMDGE